MAQSFAAVSATGSWYMLNEMLQNAQMWLAMVGVKNQSELIDDETASNTSM